jgi:hypothetical protein
VLVISADGQVGKILYCFMKTTRQEHLKHTFLLACPFITASTKPKTFMKKSILLIVLGITAISSCKKYVKEKDLDKEIKMDFPILGIGSNVAFPDFTSLPAYTYLIDFDKRDYPKVDSITFNMYVITQKPTDSAVVRLFNVTDSVAIENSTISASSPGWDPWLVHTNNIYRSLPDKRIILAIQGKGVGGAIYGPYLKLRRN